MAEETTFSKFFSRVFDADKPQLLTLLLGVAIFFALGYGLFKSDGQFLYALKDTDVSRGLITFVVAVTTISIALIVTLYAITSTIPKEDLKDRFGYAKEILTLLIGILGTILGFYFGSADKAAQDQMSIADARFTSGQLITHINGGIPPYRYTVSISGQEPDKKPTPKVSKDGWITEAIAAETKAGTSISIEITDSKDKKIVKQLAYVVEKKDQDTIGNSTPINSQKVPVPPATQGTTPAQGANQTPLPQSSTSQQSAAPAQSVKPQQNSTQAATPGPNSASK